MLSLTAKDFRTANLTLAAYLNRYRYLAPFREDLRQDAYMALVQAARTFDPDRGCAFQSYASDGIRFHLAARAPEYLNALHVPKGFRSLSESEDSVPDEGVDPSDSLSCMDAKQVSDRVRLRLRREVGTRNTSIWWDTEMNEGTYTSAGKRFGLTLERARQIVASVNSAFMDVTEDIRAEAY